MRKLTKYLRPYWWKIILVIIFVALSAYLNLEIPRYMGKISSEISYFVETSMVQGLVAGTAQYDAAYQTMVDTIRGYGIKMLIITLIGLFVSVMVPFLNTHIATSFGRDLRNAVFARTQDLSLHEYNRVGAAGLLTRLTSDIDNVKALIQFATRVIIQGPAFIIISIIQITRFQARATYFWLLVGGLIIIGITMGVIFYQVVPKFTVIQEKVDRVTLLLRQDLTGVRVIRAFNQEDRENKYFEEGNASLANEILVTNRIISFLNPIINIVFNVMTVAIYLVAFSFISQREPAALSVFGESVAVSQYVSMIMMAFLMITMLFFSVPRAQASAKRINEVLDAPISIEDPENPMVPFADTRGLVEFDKVSFQFPDANKPTLIDINFKVHPGETMAIIGTTGSGKSSIINLIPRFYDASTGLVSIDGQDVRAFSLRELREKIGFVPQTALLFSGTIASNLKMGKEDATEEEMWEALEIAQAADFVRELPEQLDAPVGRGGNNFSGGQKQRLSIARALIKKPEVYIFDDSFSALDFKTDIRLRSALSKTTKESAVIIVGQRVSSILDADEILVLDNGVIAGQGTHDYLIQNCEVYQEIVNSQLDEDEIERAHAMKGELGIEGGNN